ncbi:MAG: polysaccharide deacetylase family protein [Bryobacteraceae bacterium]
MGGPVAIAAALGAAAWAVRGRSSRAFGNSVWKGPGDRPDIALTFDDGPSPGTEALLDTLADFGVPATFFICGVHARRQPGTVRRIVELGHEPGNHTDTHPRLWLRSPAYIQQEIAVAQRAIVDAGGVAPKWFRAPFGVRWFGVDQAQRQLGLTGAMWTVMGSDWRLDGAAVAKRMKTRAHNGAIFCLHDGRELQPEPDIANTIDAVRIAVPALLRDGYRFRTLTELCNPCAVE